MAKVTQVQDGDSGAIARAAWNEAIDTVEVDGTTITGDGTVGDPLVGTPDFNTGAIFSTSNTLLFNDAKNFVHGTSSVPITGDLTVSETGAKNQVTCTVNHSSELAPAINLPAGYTFGTQIGTYDEQVPAVLNKFFVTLYPNSGKADITYRRNEAINTVEVDGITITGDGTVGDPLVGAPDFNTGAILSTSNTLLFNDAKNFVHGTSSVPITGDLTVSETGAKNQVTCTVNHSSELAPAINLPAGYTFGTQIGTYDEQVPAVLNQFFVTLYPNSGKADITYRRNVADASLPDFTGNAKKMAFVNDGETDIAYAAEVFYDATSGELRIGDSTISGAKVQLKSDGVLSGVAWRIVDANDVVMYEHADDGTASFYGKAATAMYTAQFHDRNGNVKAGFLNASNVDTVKLKVNEVNSFSGTLVIGDGTQTTQAPVLQIQPAAGVNTFDATRLKAMFYSGRVNNLPTAECSVIDLKGQIFSVTQWANNSELNYNRTSSPSRGSNQNITSAFDFVLNHNKANLGQSVGIGEISDAMTYFVNGSVYKTSAYDNTAPNLAKTPTPEHLKCIVIDNDGGFAPLDFYAVDINAGITKTYMPTFADNAAALAGGLTLDMQYKTATGELRIVV